MENEQAEIEQRAGHRLAIDHEMFFRQMPAARAHHQHRRIGLDDVVLAFRRGVVDRAGHRIAKVELAVDQASNVGAVESSKSAMKTFAPELSALMIILRSTGTGDLDAPVLQRGRNRGDAPIGIADRCGLGCEIGQIAGVVSRLPFVARAQQREATAVETMMQVGKELARRFAEDLAMGRRQWRADLRRHTGRGCNHG